MSNKVYIPFLSIFKDAMLCGQKTCTTRTKQYGQPKDTFEAWGATFEIREIARLALKTVRDKFYYPEGFSSPAGFQAVWEQLHPIRGFNPEQAVWTHSFRRTTEKNNT